MGLWTHHMKACGFGNFRWHFIWYMWFFWVRLQRRKGLLDKQKRLFSIFYLFMGHLKFGFRVIYYVRSLGMWLYHCIIIIFFLYKKLVIAFNWSLIKIRFFWVNWFLFIYFWLKGSMVEKGVICVIVWLQFMRVVMNIVRLDRKKH